MRWEWVVTREIAGILGSIRKENSPSDKCPTFFVGRLSDACRTPVERLVERLEKDKGKKNREKCPTTAIFFVGRVKRLVERLERVRPTCPTCPTNFSTRYYIHAKLSHTS